MTYSSKEFSSIMVCVHNDYDVDSIHIMLCIVHTAFVLHTIDMTHNFCSYVMGAHMYWQTVGHVQTRLEHRQTLAEHPL